jgi:hypothetical protein
VTTLLQEFEEWLKAMAVGQDLDSDLNSALFLLEQLKKKHKAEKWTMPEEAFRWLAFQHDYNALKEKHKV